MDVVIALVLSELMCVVFLATAIKATTQLYTIDLCFYNLHFQQLSYPCLQYLLLFLEYLGLIVYSVS